jgi:hypothetical protein
MSGKLVVLTGVHRMVRLAITQDAKSFNGISYFPSIADDLRQRGASGHWESCPFFDELLMHQEMQRDSVILPLLQKSQSVVLIEQWHIGNIAWAKARSSDTAQKYEERLYDQLKLFNGINIEVWYVSTDLEKIMPSRIRVPYESYLKELSNLLKHLRFPVQNLDGDAPSEFVRKRILYLLTGEASAYL